MKLAEPITPKFTRRQIIKKSLLASVAAPLAWKTVTKYKEDKTLRLLRPDDDLKDFPEFLNEHLLVIYEALGIKVKP